MLSENSKCVVESKGFLEVLAEDSEVYGEGNQEDVQEFLMYLLDKIHEDLNRVKEDDEGIQLEELTSFNIDPADLESVARRS
jgi:ubiquitin C-terminal hydrolase